MCGAERYPIYIGTEYRTTDDIPVDLKILEVETNVKGSGLKQVILRDLIRGIFDAVVNTELWDIMEEAVLPGMVGNFCHLTDSVGHSGADLNQGDGFIPFYNISTIIKCHNSSDIKHKRVTLTLNIEEVYHIGLLPRVCSIYLCLPLTPTTAQEDIAAELSTPYGDGRIPHPRDSDSMYRFKAYHVAEQLDYPVTHYNDLMANISIFIETIIRSFREERRKEVGEQKVIPFKRR